MNVPQLIPAGANLNNYTTAGLYYNSMNADAQKMTNLPTKNAFSLFVEKHNGTKQTFTAYFTTGVQTWVRNLDWTGNWGSWVQVAMVYNGVNEPTPDLGLDGNIYIKIDG